MHFPIPKYGQCPSKKFQPILKCTTNNNEQRIKNSQNETKTKK